MPTPTTPLRILHLAESLRPGNGVTTAVRSVVSAQRLAGLDARIAVVEGSDGDETHDASSIHSPESTTSDAPDLVHMHGLWSPSLRRSIKAIQQRRWPMVLSPHGMLTDWALSQSRFKKIAYRKLLLDRVMPSGADRFTIHYCTNWEQEHSSGYWRTPSRESTGVVPLSLDVRAINEQLTTQQPEAAAEKNAAFVFLGRVHPGKGLEYLIPALSHAAPAVRLVVIGDADTGHGRMLRREAETAGVSERIEWAGAVYPPDLYARLAEASALVLPSDHENFGLVAIEAVASGTPVLVSREVAVGPALVDAGAAAFVEREPRKLGEQLSAWATQKASELEAMRDRSNAAAEAFDHHAIGAAWLSFYREALHRAR